jgi:hypothetical protein
MGRLTLDCHRPGERVEDANFELLFRPSSCLNPKQQKRNQKGSKNPFHFPPPFFGYFGLFGYRTRGIVTKEFYPQDGLNYSCRTKNVKLEFKDALLSKKLTKR